MGDDYYTLANNDFKIFTVGGSWHNGSLAGIGKVDTDWNYSTSDARAGARLIKTPIQS